jgi:hypothetical protein
MNKRPLAVLLTTIAVLLAGATTASAVAVPDVWVHWLGSPPGATVRSLDFTTPATLFAGSDGDGVYSSPTAVGPWTQSNSGLEPQAAKQVRQVVAAQGTLYAATSAGLFNSLTGASWQPVGQGAGTRKLNQGGVQSVIVPAPGNIVAAVAGASPPGVFYSSDNGEHWDRAGGMPQGEHVYYMTTSPGNAPPWYAATDSGVYTSLNLGRDWLLTSDGIPPGETTLRVAIDPTTAPPRLYASTSSSVYKSTNGGITWSDASGAGDKNDPEGGALPAAGKRAFLLAPSLGNQFGAGRLIVGTEQGVWGSVDDGAHWKPLSQSVPTPPGQPSDTMNRHVWAMALGFGGPQGYNLMAGTAGNGIYTLPLTDLSNKTAPVASPGNVTLTQGQKLSVTGGAWEGTSPYFYKYQWLTCTSSLPSSCTGHPIANATGPTYVIPAGATNTRYAVDVTVRNLVKKDPITVRSNLIGNGTVNAPAPNAPVPASGGGPTVTPNAASYPWGTVFTALPGTWKVNGNAASPTFTYQWQQCDQPGGGCADIPGQTATTYTSRKADIGHHIQVLVTATVGGVSNTRNAVETNQIIQKTPVNTTKPRIVGDPWTGVTLGSTAGGWNGDQITYTRRWFKCNQDGVQCEPIPGETGATYVVKPTDKESRLQLEVTATSPDPQNVPRTKVEVSEFTPVITDPPPPPSGDPGSGDPGSGDPGSGDPGSGDPGSGDPGSGGSKPVVKIKKPSKIKVGAKLSVPAKLEGFTKISYQWLRNGKKIKGATKRVYKIKRKDRGKRIACRLVLKPGNVKLTTKAVKVPKKG